MSYRENFDKSGYNADVDASANEIVWGSGSFTKMASAGPLTIVSGSSDDDGVASGTLTLSSAVANAFATGTVTCASAQAGDTVTVNGLLYTAVSGTKADNTEFSIDTSDDATATDLADSIDNDTREGTTGDVSATSSTDTVTITTDVEGTAGNAITLVSSNGTRLALSGATFSGGVDADVATVNGLTYTGVAGTKADNTQFSIDTSDTAAAADLADSIANDTRTGVTEPTYDVTATSSSGVVTIHATSGGADPEGIDISGTANITASGANLAGSGTGARTVFIEGLADNGDIQRRTYYLNGTTDVTTNEDWLGVNSVEVTSVGSGGTNAGVITVKSGSDVQGIIAIGIGRSQDGICHVPTGMNAEISEVFISVSSGGTAPIVETSLWEVDSLGVKSRIAGPLVVDCNTNANGKFEFDNPIVVSAGGYWYAESDSDQDNAGVLINVTQDFVNSN